MQIWLNFVDSSQTKSCAKKTKTKKKQKKNFFLLWNFKDNQAIQKVLHWKMLHELLFALNGFPGYTFTIIDGKFKV